MSVFLNKKINAGALQYTLFVAVVIVILIATFLSLTYLQNHFKTSSDFHIQSIQNSDQGFAYNSIKEIPYEQEQKIKLISDVESHLTLQKKRWGMFDILDVSSEVNKSTFQKTGLLGGYISKKPALYLKDNNRALVLVGNTKIQGKAYLSQKSVKRGNIAGHSYYGEQLIYGPVLQSESILPELKNRKYIEQLSKGIFDSSTAIYLDLYKGLKEVNSFSNPTKIYKQKRVVQLTDIQLTGNYIIQSDTLIKITDTALLKDVLLLAPNIEIFDRLQGNFQAIASEKITVGSYCNLVYPSALILVDQGDNNPDKKKNSVESHVLINSNSSVKGCVVYLSKKEASNYNPQIFIDENTVISGEIYCDKNLELKGTVYGTVYTNNFIAKQFGSVYQNHIYNGSILNAKLPQQYVGLAFENSIQKVSKWLY